VVAIDLQPRFLMDLNASNLEVRNHDILNDQLPERMFDLVHARGLLAFLPKPEKAIAKMAAALKPGGWGSTGGTRLRFGGARFFYAPSRNSPFQKGMERIAQPSGITGVPAGVWPASPT
jgi:SAM-dependent methyltransferase